MLPDRSVAGNGGIDFKGPAFDAPGHAPDVRVAFLAEEEGRFGTAHPVVAVDDNDIIAV